jgi:hypothetical protein
LKAYGLLDTASTYASDVAGSNTQIQYNNSGAFGASSNFTYTSGTNTLTTGNITGSALGMTITPRVPTVAQTPLALVLAGQNSVGTTRPGGPVTITAGNGGSGGSARGGAVNITSGNGGGGGGNINITTGIGTGAAFVGADIFLETGSGGYRAGNVNLTCGEGTAQSGYFRASGGGFSGSSGGSFICGNAELGLGGSVLFIGGYGNTTGGSLEFRPGIGVTTNGTAQFNNAFSNKVIEVGGASGAPTLGFFGATPVVRVAAYTQTFSTASRTVSNPTFSNLVTTAATNVVPYGFTTQAQADDIATKVNQLAADVAILRQLINSLIDDSQAYGLAQ